MGTCRTCNKTIDLGAADDLPPLEFWNSFLHGHIVPFRHREYIRAASMFLALPENWDRGILEVATDFANKILDFKQRNSQFQLLPEHRTTTVLWLYQVRLALESLWKVKGYKDSCLEAPPLPVLLSHAPELLNEKLPKEYYTEDVLNSEEARQYWMLPTNKPLPESVSMPKPIAFMGFGNNTKTDINDFYYERYLRMALVIVQCYLRPGETRRRSWFINLGFSAMQTRTIKLRSFVPEVPLYSETHFYFYLQLVHAALSQLQTTPGNENLIQNLTFHSFQQLFAIKPSIWKKHYSPKHWDCLQSRGRFNPPDLKPLPTTIPLASESLTKKTSSIQQDFNEPFRKLGLIPEFPPQEIILFNLDIFFEDYKTVTLPISPSSDTPLTDAHLLKYIHSFIIRTGSTETIPSRAKTALLLLSRNPSLNLTRTTFLLNLSLSKSPGISLAYPSIPSLKPNPDFTPPLSTLPGMIYGRIQISDRGRTVIRHHNCPCHHELPMSENGPKTKEAVIYPTSVTPNPPIQIMHGCDCHFDLPLDQEALTRVIAKRFLDIEKSEKIPKGTACSWADKRKWTEDDWFQRWIRKNLVLVCAEELGSAWYGSYGEKKWGGEQGKKEWVRPKNEKIGNDEFVLFLEPKEDEENDEGVVEAWLEGLSVQEDEDAKTLGGKEEEEEDWENLSEAGTLI
ncbi:hypothetical protein QBC38DRAFT_547157 [Podospora fimiseda]|uniref:Uncharacterized protein n=1 Tax=Podospora fimiseda TaxID=252190 RepID=A0AAN7GV79_9PEZI|nr:hypothetical protein QBC38DRAFT_547157 [Podospora fimiseda]